jgi:hypothetical protein
MYLRYAKPYLPLAIPLTLISWWLICAKGPAAISGAFFLKAMTMLLGYAVLRKLHRFDIFFYQNVGYGERKLLLVTAVADLLIWLTGVVAIVIVMS